MEVTRTITWIEIMWTVPCALGLIYTLKLCRGALRDLFAVKAKKINSIREYAAIVTIVAFVIPLVMMSTFTAIGIMTMTIPSPPSAPITPIQVVILASFLGSTGVSVALIVRVNFMRHKLMAMIMQAESFNGD